jgi:hypothetical protein
VRMGRLIRTSLQGVALVGLIGMLGDASSAAATGPLQVIPSCAKLAGSPVAYRDGSVVVYEAAISGDGGGSHEWACSKTASGPTSASALGTVPGGGFASGAVVADFVADGPWLVNLVSSSRGWNSCPPATNAHPCRRERDEVELTDTADGGQTTTSSGAHVDIHLSVVAVSPRTSPAVSSSACSYWRSATTWHCPPRSIATRSDTAGHPAPGNHSHPATKRPLHPAQRQRRRTSSTERHGSHPRIRHRAEMTARC